MAHVLTLLPAKARAPMRNTPNAARPASSPRANRGPAGRDGARDAFSQMVEQMPINVMMCDTKDFKITYINQNSIETLRPLEHLLPIKASQLLGQSIDILHENPGHQRRLLGDAHNLPHRTRIELGEESLDLRVSAIRDKAGNYLGPMLTWSVVSGQVRMADNFEQNVMGAVQQQGAATQEIARIVQQAAQGTQEVSGNISTVSHAASESGQSTSSLPDAACELAKQSEVLRGEVGKFLGEVRAI